MQQKWVHPPEGCTIFQSLMIRSLVSGLNKKTITKLKYAFLRFINNKLAFLFNSLIHDTRVLCYFINKTSNAFKFTFQKLFHPLYIEYFSQVPHVLFRYRFSYVFQVEVVLQFNYNQDIRIPFLFLYYI